MTLGQMALKKVLQKFDRVPFAVEFSDENEFIVGEGEPTFRVVVSKDGVKSSDLLKSTSLALGEAYMDGTIQVDGDLFTALDCIMSQISLFTVDSNALRSILHPSSKKKAQKEEVCSHYDIGNDFYRLWLDPSLSYSCAYFKQESDTLEQAQIHKIEHTLEKMHLEKGMQLLDIGCGWGSLLIAAAKEYGVSGLGITLSEEQYKACQERIKQENLEGQVEVRLMDYRDLKKSGLSFDRIVSVGMLEHVTRENYELFFENANQVLKPEGLFLLHYISSRKESEGDPWIKKYIFPGGMIPSLREIIYLTGEYNYYVTDVESLRRHYMKTLLCWYSNFQEHREEVSAMFDERFARMWELYLCSCAASFHNGVVDIHQIVMTKGVNNKLPMTRDSDW